MTARDDLFRAARALAERGMVPFSPIELTEEARRQGSNYADRTLTSMVGHYLRVEEGSGEAGFLRVGRGLYRLTEADSTAVPPPPPQLPGTEPRAGDDWSWEGNVQAAVVSQLAADGWRIVRVADTASREQGVDVEARRGDERLLVEVKGYPSPTHTRGARQGEAKTYGAATQGRTYYGNALLAGLLMRAEHRDARVALAFPDVGTFRSLADRTAGPLAAANVELWLVGEDGRVGVVPAPT